jgi:hypothetical protein
MARIGKAQRALDRAHEHRQKIEQLLAEPDCLRPWFLDWAESQLERDRFYIYTETEHAVLERELERLKPYRGFAGYGIDELLRAATGYCADCDLDDQAFLERLNRRSRLNFRSGNYCTWSESAGMLPAWMCHSKKIWKPP